MKKQLRAVRRWVWVSAVCVGSILLFLLGKSWAKTKKDIKKVKTKMEDRETKIREKEMLIEMSEARAAEAERLEKEQAEKSNAEREALENDVKTDPTADGSARRMRDLLRRRRERPRP